MVFKGIIVRIPFLWVEGMALFPFVLLKNRFPHRNLLNHECIHLRQQLETGFVLFYVWYLSEYLIRLLYYGNHYKAYRQISFEREAFANESKADYLYSRSFWAFLKYI
jgi:hypothetical protein